jgi:hypothetical protein
MTLKKRLSQIIIEVIKNENLSNVKMGKALGVDKNTIDAYRRMTRGSNTEFVAKFCEKYHVNPDWILFGKGNKYLKEDEILEPASVYNKVKEGDALHGTAPKAVYDFYDNRRHRKADDDYMYVGKALDILAQESVYSRALKANIYAFYNAMQAEQKLKVIQKNLLNQEALIKDLEKRTIALEKKR